MIFKILLTRNVQMPNSDKTGNLLPLQTFVCNISRHLEFIIHCRTGSPGQLGLRVAGFPDHWVAGSQNLTQFHPCFVWGSAVSSLCRFGRQTLFMHFQFKLADGCNNLPVLFTGKNCCMHPIIPLLIRHWPRAILRAYVHKLSLSLSLSLRFVHYRKTGKDGTLTATTSV